MIQPAPLPYPYDSLEPWMSEATLRFHHDGHYLRYVQRTNERTQGRFTTPSEAYFHALEIGDVGLRHQAAQAWAHERFFEGMAPPLRRGSPSPALGRALLDFADFPEALCNAAQSVFGSGWVHVVLAPLGDGPTLRIETTHGGSLPRHPAVMTPHVSEHAYYLDYPDDRPRFCQVWLRQLVDWDVASRRYVEGQRRATAVRS